MKSMKNKEEYNSITSDILDELLQGITPKEQRITDRRMLLAARINDAMKAVGLKKGELARALGKHPSEITKWLSGTHNFTTDTLWEIGDALGIELINIDEPKYEPVVHQSFLMISLQPDIPDCYTPNSEFQERGAMPRKFKTNVTTLR